MNSVKKFILFIVAFFSIVASISSLLFAQDAPAAKQNPTAKQNTEQKTETSDLETADEQLPLLEDLPSPNIEELLKGEKQDWIVLVSGRVLKVPALHPRPDHLAWLLENQKKMIFSRPDDPDLLQQWIDKYKGYNFIDIEFSDQGIEEDYSLHVRYISQILYHEDLALQKANQLIKAGNAVDAQRLILAVGRWGHRNNLRRKKEKLAPIPWPQLLNRQRELLLLNVKQARFAGHWERAFNLVKIHRGFDSPYAQLPQLLGEDFEQIAEQAIQNSDYRKVRFFLRQLQAMYPAHEQLKTWQDQLIRLSQEKMQQATKALQERKYREASELAQRAIRVWPFNSQFRRQVQTIQERYQVLRTGQIEKDDQIDFHQRSLLDHRWFHVEKISEGYPRYRSRFIESWIPGDLGLSIRLKMKLERQPHESRPLLESYQLARQLAAVSLKGNPENRSLFANSIDSIHVLSPDQLDVQITTQTAHPLGLFAGLLDTHLARPQASLKNTFFRPEGKLDPADNNESPSIFVRAFPEPDNAGSFGVAEVRSRLFPDREELLRAMLRDELDYVPHLPLAYVKRLRQDQRFFVLKYHTPQVTLIQFHFQGAFAQDPALRLALFAALNREKLMAQIAQYHGSGQKFFRITNSIAPTTSHAENQSHQVVQFDRTSARALYTILDRSQKVAPELKLLVSEDSESVRLAELIKVQWESLGTKVKFVSAGSFQENESEKAPWDAAIVTHRMLAPQHDLPRLLSNGHQLTESELQSLPLSIQRSLLKLEEAHHWNEVDNSLRELQDDLAIDAWMLPLWEQHCYQAIRREVRNVPAAAMRPYQNLDRWVVEPVIPAY